MGLKDSAVTAFGFIVIIGVVIAVILAIAQEFTNPCVERGPRELSHMQKVGDIYIPVYHEPCIRRTN